MPQNNQNPFNTGTPFGGVPQILNNLSNFATQNLPGVLPALSVFNPDLLNNPAVQFITQAGLGQQQSNALQGIIPTLQRLGSSFGNLRGPGGGNLPVSILGAGQQAINERQAAFEQQRNQQRAQEEVLANFRERVQQGQGQIDTIDLALRRAGLENNVQLRQGLMDLRRTRQEAQSFLAQGLQFLNNTIEDIRSGNQEVLENLDTDIAQRAADLKSGVEARNKQIFGQFEAQLDSVSPLTADERAVLRSMREIQTGADMATGLGQLHAAAAEYRGAISSNLQESLNTAQSYAANSAAGLFQNTQAVFESMGRASVQLRESYLQENRMLNVARAELATYGAEFARMTGITEFEMVSQMTRPVAVFSDILFDSFDLLTDAMQFNNNVALQQVSLDAAAIDPRFALYLSGLGDAANQLNIDEQIDAARQASRDALTGSLIGAGGAVAGGFAGNPGLFRGA